MSSHFAPVVEAFHTSSGNHAHVVPGNDNTFTYENGDGQTISEPSVSDKSNMYAYDGTRAVKRFNSTTSTWENVNINAFTSIPELTGILTTNQNLNLAIKGISGEINSESFNPFFIATVTDYFVTSHLINDYQEITSINNYVKTLQHDEFTRLSKLNDKFTNEVLSTKEMYLMANRDTYQIRSNIRLIMYSIVTLAILMALMPSNDTVWAKVLMGLVIIAFFVYAVLHVRNDRARRFKDFSKKFFSKGDLPDISKDAEEEKDKENGNGETCTD